jgi:outer membrane protein assembly factor BamB
MIQAFASNGDRKWNVSLPGGTTGAQDMTLFGDVLYFNSDDVYGMRILDGSLVFDASVPSALAAWGAPAVDDDGSVYTGSAAGLVVKLNAKGQMQWSVSVGGIAITTALSIGPTGIVYAVTGDFNANPSKNNTVLALSSQGQILWKYQIGAPTTADLAFGADGTLLVGSRDGVVYALNI